MKKLLSLCLALLLCLPQLPAARGAQIVDPVDPVPLGVVSSAEYQVAPGVRELALTVNTADADQQSLVHVLEVDPSEPTLSFHTQVRRGTPVDFGLERCSDQAADTEQELRQQDPNATVVGCVNASYYNMDTGEPLSVLVKDGEYLHTRLKGFNYFWVDREGHPAFGMGDQPVPDNIWQAVGGADMILHQGQIVRQYTDYTTALNPRTVIGLRADGTVLLVQVDGRQAPTSVGMHVEQVGVLLQSLGCVEALNLDGGGSSTFLSRRAGEDRLQLRNSPSDGCERSVSSALMVVSTAAPTQAEPAPTVPACTHDWFLIDRQTVRCTLCGAEQAVADFTGLCRDSEASRCVICGVFQTGWITWGDRMLHANEDGRLHQVTTTDSRTCTANGRVSAVCATCGAKYQGPALYRFGHDWDENHLCRRCGAAGKNLADLQVNPVSARYLYRDSGVQPTPTVYDGETRLELKSSAVAKDGVLTWYGHHRLGTAWVEVEGRGDYYGLLRMEYQIILDKVAGVTASGVEGTSLCLNWEPTQGAQYYIVYRYDFSTKALVELGRTDGQTTGFFLEGLQPNTSYTLCVKAAAEVEETHFESYSQTWVQLRTTRDPEPVSAAEAGIGDLYLTTPSGWRVEVQPTALGPTLFVPGCLSAKALPLVVETATGQSVTLAGPSGEMEYTGAPFNLYDLTCRSADQTARLDIRVGEGPAMRIRIMESNRKTLFLQPGGALEMVSSDGDTLCLAEGWSMTATDWSTKRDLTLRFPTPETLTGSSTRGLQWRLSAMTEDPTPLTQRMYWRAAKKAGLDGAGGTHWVEVYAEGCYQGLYQLTLDRTPDAELLSAFLTTLEQPDLIHPETGLHYDEYADPDALALSWLLCKYAGRDLQLGYVTGENGLLSAVPNFDSPAEDSAFLERLTQLPDFMTRARRQYLTKLRPVLVTLTTQGGALESASKSLPKSMARDLRRWQGLAWDGQSLDGQAQTLSAALDAGLARLDALLEVDESSQPDPVAPGHEDCPGAAFEDMPPLDNWAHAPIDWAVEQGIAYGKTLTYFGLNDACTRAQMVTFLWRAAGSPEPEMQEQPFDDVPLTSFWEKPVRWALEQDITRGMSPTIFAPDLPCTRGQAMTFLHRFAGLPDPEGEEMPFHDVPPNVYYTEAVRWAVGQGITNGKTLTRFAPQDACTRAHIVTFLYRLLQPAEA